MDKRPPEPGQRSQRVLRDKTAPCLLHVLTKDSQRGCWAILKVATGRRDLDVCHDRFEPRN
jgi:hypothetical protein